MTLSCMVVSRDWQEVGVLECILGGLHIAVNVESQLERAQSRLQKSKVDALILDCDLGGTNRFLRGLHELKTPSSVPLLIVSGSSSRSSLESTGASFVFEKPISVEQAVHTLSAARNLILDGRLRYYRQSLTVPAKLSCGRKDAVEANVINLSQGGVGVRVHEPLRGQTIVVMLVFDLCRSVHK
jgi:DNA-binding NtrC family response regulator